MVGLKVTHFPSDGVSWPSIAGEVGKVGQRLSAMFHLRSERSGVADDHAS